MVLLDFLVEKFRCTEFNWIVEVGISASYFSTVYNVVGEQEFDKEVATLVGNEYLVQDDLSVDQVHPVEVVEGVEQLSCDSLDGFLGDTYTVVRVPVQQVLLATVHDQIAVGLALLDFQDLDNVGVVNKFNVFNEFVGAIDFSVSFAHSKI